MFLLMLRSGLRVEEVAHLTLDAVEYRKRQVFVASGKGAKERVVYLSDDARAALETYLKKRSSKKGAPVGADHERHGARSVRRVGAGQPILEPQRMDEWPAQAAVGTQEISCVPRKVAY